MQQRFETILDALAESVTIRDPQDSIIYANQAALTQLGFESVEELAKADPAAIMGDFVVTGEDGLPLGMQDIPSVRIFRGEEPEPLLIKTVHRDTGEEKWQLLKAAPLYGDDGRIEATATVIEDVTTAKRAELRAAFLARASGVLGASLDHELTLRNVAELAVPEIADWCAVHLIGADGRPHRVVAAHADPAQVQLGERIRGYEDLALGSDHGVGQVAATGLPQLIEDVTDEMLQRSALGDDHLGLLREMQIRSVLLVPMNAAGKTVGVLSLVTAESARRLQASDMDFALQLAARAAVAVENSRLYAERVAIAETLQASLLPEALPPVPGWDIGALYRSAAAGAEVGGDFYDVFPVGDSWIVLIGDVTGKGVHAASMTSLVRHSARIVAQDTPDPAAIMQRLNDVIWARERSAMCSALCLRLDGARITLSSAGHPLPLVVSSEQVRMAGCPGTLLGALRSGRWDNQTETVTGHEALLLYTDGVTDTVGPDDRFGEQRLREAAMACCGGTAAELLAGLDARLSAFQHGAQADDTAALALRPVSA